MGKKQIWIALAAMALGITGCAAGTANETVSLETGTSAGSMDQEETEIPEESRGESQAELPYAPGRLGDEYILPAGQEHVYTEEELSVLTSEELRIGRNEIYARHGRRFSSDDLNRYFSAKTWYQPSVEPDAFDETVLSQTERDNISLLKRLEEERLTWHIPRMGTEEFPLVDGSTATLPISLALYQLATDSSLSEAEAAISHNKTSQAWLNLAGCTWQEELPDLVIAYEPGETVLDQIEREGGEIIIKPIGRDALVFLRNSSNPVHSLTGSQIVDIYSGRISSWKEVGGSDQRIMAFQRPSRSGSQNLMDKLVMKGRKMAPAPTDRIASDMGDLIESVSSYDNEGNALGYSVYYYARNMYQKPGLAFLAVDGVEPDNRTIRSGEYPYVNDFYAGIRADEPEDSRARELFDWLTSEEGQSLVNGLGYVGVEESAKELPRELKEETAFDGRLPLAEGHVLLANGRWIYGETGIAVFDSGLKLLRFISHAESSLVRSSLVCEKDAVLPMRDTRTGTERYYSLAEDSWVEALPEKWKKYEDSDEELYGWAYTFAEDYPELLASLGADSEAVRVIHWGETTPPSICISSGGIEHYYGRGGVHLLDYDPGTRPEGDETYWRYVRTLDGHTACLAEGGGGREGMCYSLYRDGELFKTIQEGAGEYINPESLFYTVSRGSYLYVYNYEDQLCGKFLQSYIQND